MLACNRQTSTATCVRYAQRSSDILAHCPPPHDPLFIHPQASELPGVRASEEGEHPCLLYPLNMCSDSALPEAEVISYLGAL